MIEDNSSLRALNVRASRLNRHQFSRQTTHFLKEAPPCFVDRRDNSECESGRLSTDARGEAMVELWPYWRTRLSGVDERDNAWGDQANSGIAISSWFVGPSNCSKLRSPTAQNGLDLFGLRRGWGVKTWPKVRGRGTFSKSQGFPLYKKALRDGRQAGNTWRPIFSNQPLESYSNEQRTSFLLHALGEIGSPLGKVASSSEEELSGGGHDKRNPYLSRDPYLQGDSSDFQIFRSLMKTMAREI